MSCSSPFGNILVSNQQAGRLDVYSEKPSKDFHEGMEAVISDKKEVGKVVFFPEAK